MSLAGVLGDTKESTLGVVNPVRGKETAEGCYECNTSVVRNSPGNCVDLRRVLDEAQVVLEELDTRASNSNAALKSVDGLATLSEVVCNSGKKTGLGDDRFATNVVKQEAASTVCVLGLAGLEATLTHEGRGLVTQAASNRDTLEGSLVKSTIGSGVGRRDDLGQADLGAINIKELEKVLIIIEGLQVHEHSTTGVGGIGDKDWSTLTQWQAASFLELLGTGLVLKVTDEGRSTSVRPNNSIVKGLASCVVPENGGFTLVCDTNRANFLNTVALGTEFLGCLLNANLGRLEKGHGVMLVPSRGRVKVLEFHLMAGYRLTMTIEDEEPG
ncbi:hypothetical protein HG531_005293 [Fusarium graminearum]|nr:hypothetical protein HG531_005293 [Fusarium graminearum]